MVVTIEDVINALSSTEPRYKRAAKFGVEVLPHLEMLIKTASPIIAARAAYTAGLIQDEKSTEILMLAARSKIIQVRLAAADTIRNLPVSSMERVSEVLKNDVDKGVRRITLKSIEVRNKENAIYKDK